MPRLDALKRLIAQDPRQNPGLIAVIFLGAIVLLGVYLRYKLIPGINGDYTVYISNWYDHLYHHGFGGFKDNFANYNFPYLFLLYVASNLPIEKLVAIKMISITFDALLCYAVYAIVRALSLSKTRALIAAIVTFMLPTVFINSSYWGQTDAIYTSFLLLSLLGLLRGKSKSPWFFFGVAIAFKLQAIFFAPVLLYVWLRRKGKWWNPFVSIGTFVALSIPPVFTGRSLTDTFSVYANQYGYQPSLSAHVPNFYFWMPQQFYEVINSAGIIFGLMVVLMAVYASSVKMRYTKYNILLMASFFALIVPYVLPQMHDRYFYLFEVLMVVLAFVDVRYIVALLAMQFVTINVYLKTLLGSVEVPFGVLSAIVTTIAAASLYIMIRRLDVSLPFLSLKTDKEVDVS